jgi:hypothetical protein
MISIISISLALVIPAVFMTQYFTARGNFNRYQHMINLQNIYVVNIDLLNDEDLNFIPIDELVETMSFIENAYLYSRIHSNFIMHHHQFIVGGRLTEIALT